MRAVVAETAGVVREILVAVGDGVAIGQELALIEVMKMRIPVEAPVAGTVSAIAARAGETVAKGAVLLTLE